MCILTNPKILNLVFVSGRQPRLDAFVCRQW